MIAKIIGHGEKKRYVIDGKHVSEGEFTSQVQTRTRDSGDAGEGSGACGSSLVGFKPIHSDSLGVHPRQVAKAQADAAKKGVPTEFDKKGRPIFTSRQHRKQYCEAYGYFDRDAGYGDAQRRTSRTTGPDESEIRKHYDNLLSAAQGPERGNVIEAIREVKRRHGLS